jgi:tetratricopeptide (TPR) repeat protein
MSSRKNNSNKAVAATSERRSPGNRSPVRLTVILAIAVILVGVILWEVHISTALLHAAEGGRLLRDGKTEPAAREYRAAVNGQPGNAEAWDGLGQALFADRKWKDAQEAFLNVLRLKPETPHVNEHLAVCSVNLSDAAAAGRYADAELKRDPNNKTVLNMLADKQIAANDDGKALDAMRRLAKIDPSNGQVYLRLGRTLYGEHLYAEAVPILDHLLEIAPGDGRVYFLRGAALLEANMGAEGLARAAADFREFLRLHPGSYLPHRYLGRTYLKMSKWSEAAAELEVVAHEHPELKDVHLDLQTAYQHLGRKDKAEAARKRFMALRKEEDRAYELEKICAVEPNNFDAFFELGGLYFKSGNFKRSGSAYYQASRIRPSDPRPQAGMRKVEAAMNSPEAAEEARFWQQ